MARNMEIRPAKEADANSIRSCAEESYAQYVHAIGKKPAPMVADFDSQIDAGFLHVAVCPAEDVMGFIVFYQDGKHVLLENVAVRTKHSGQGIGKALISFCEEHAKRIGAQSIKLYTNEKMTANLSIYPHLGYQEVARATEDGFNRVYFEKLI